MEPIDFNFPDSRLADRANQSLNKIAERPGLSFPNIFSNPSELEGFYRFLNNPRVTYEQMRKDLIENTLKKIRSLKVVLALHDTTHISLSDRAKKIVAFNGSRGFFAHTSLLVSAENCKEVFGVGNIHTWGREEKTSKKKTKNKSKNKVNERACWLNNIKELEETDHGDCKLIHVTDSEGDMFAVWSWLKEEGQHFVIRAKNNREIILESNIVRMFDEIRKASVLTSRKIKIARREAKGPPAAQTKHPSREARETEVNISAMKVNVYYTNDRNKALNQNLEINLVRVFEVPPADGSVAEDDLMEWMLITTEPIETSEEVLRVVDIYRARWLIEEFFKGLKTGCHIEDRQVQDVSAWYKLVILFLPITANILNLRLFEKTDLNDQYIFSPITKTQLQILSIQSQKQGQGAITNYYQAKLQIARLGGHLKRNGPPGWLILHRGYQKLLALEEGWELCAHRDM